MKKYIFSALVAFFLVTAEANNGNAKFYISKSLSNHETAIKDCNALGMKLVEPLIPEYFVRHLKATDALDSDYWTGGKKINGSWIWISSGKKVPGFYASSEGCVKKLKNTVHLTNEKCDKQLHYVCQN